MSGIQLQNRMIRKNTQDSAKRIRFAAAVTRAAYLENDDKISVIPKNT